MPEKCAEPCAELQKLEQSVEALRVQNGNSHQGIYDRLRALETSSAVQKTQFEAIMDKLDDLTRKVDALEAKPGKRWEGIVDKAVWAVLAAVIAFLLARAGL